MTSETDSLITLEKRIDNARALGLSVDAQTRDDLMRAIKEWSKRSPAVYAFPSGENILTKIAPLSIELAQAWRDLVGPKAWTPTKKTPFPLVAFIDPYSKMQQTKGTWGGDLALAKKTVSPSFSPASKSNELLIDGFEYAMPMRQADAPELMGKGAAKKAKLIAQQTVVRYLFLLDNSATNTTWKRLWNAFETHEGLCVFGASLWGEEIVRRDVLSPHVKIWMQRGTQYKEDSWLEHWRALGCGLYMTKSLGVVAPWLHEKGVDVQNEMHMVIANKVNEICSNVLPYKSAWQEMQRYLDATPGGWQVEIDGELAWQTAIAKKSSLVLAAIALPPSVGLDQKSTTGRGIWDAIMPQGTSRVELSAMLSLHRAVPVSTHIDHEVPWGRQGYDLARATIRKHPEGWVGAPSAKQNKWARDLLLHACSRHLSRQSEAVNTYCILMEHDRARTTLGNTSKAALWAIGKMLEEGVIHADSKPLPKETLPVPSQANVWGKMFSDALSKNWKNIEVDPAIAQRVKSIVEGAGMDMSTPAPSIRAKPRRI